MVEGTWSHSKAVKKGEGKPLGRRGKHSGVPLRLRERGNFLRLFEAPNAVHWVGEAEG
jgi:hypothetical protein